MRRGLETIAYRISQGLPGLHHMDTVVRANTITALMERGLVTQTARGTVLFYTLTDAGRAVVEPDVTPEDTTPEDTPAPLMIPVADLLPTAENRQESEERFARIDRYERADMNLAIGASAHAHAAMEHLASGDTDKAAIVLRLLISDAVAYRARMNELDVTDQDAAADVAADALMGGVAR